jgi:phage tail-like protein
MKNLFNVRIQIISASIMLFLFILPFADLRALDKTELSVTTVPKFKIPKIGRINLFLNNVLVDTFLEVEGIESKTEIIEHRQGGDPVTHKVPGKTSYSNIRLRKGFLKSELWQWRKQVVEGAADFRKSGAIVLLSENGKELARYKFYNAWPGGWRVLNTGDMQMLEEIELVVEGWEKQYP